MLWIIVWQTSVKARPNGEGYPICSGARVVVGINDLTTSRPELAKEWFCKNREFKPTMLTSGSSKKVIWKGTCGHEWVASVKSRSVNKTGCPYCSHNIVLEGFNDLASQKPEVAQEWSTKNAPLTPEMVTSYANKKVWWRCRKCGNEWNTLISTRSSGSKCPYCSGLILLKRFNDLGTTFPKLTKEWSIRNNPLTPEMINSKSRRNVWWKCKTCGNEWKSVVDARVNGGLCPVCADRAVLTGYNDLATTDRHLVSEWDYEKNKIHPTNISRNSRKVVWWKCTEGHSWRAKVSERTIEEKGCRVCENKYLSVLPGLLVMFYSRMKKLTLLVNDESAIGIPLELYLPEEKVAIETQVFTEKIEVLKQHLCSQSGIQLIKVPYKIGMDEVIYAAKIKNALRRGHNFLSSDEEEDVIYIRKSFLNWIKQNRVGGD